jgi:hypothetical protein
MERHVCEPFGTPIIENDKVIYFKEGIPCNIKFRNWTSKGKLRIPSQVDRLIGS